MFKGNFKRHILMLLHEKGLQETLDLAFGDFFFFLLGSSFFSWFSSSSSFPSSSWSSCCSSCRFFLFFFSFSAPPGTDFLLVFFSTSFVGTTFLGAGSSASDSDGFSDCFSNSSFFLEVFSWTVISAFTVATSPALGGPRVRFLESDSGSAFPLPLALAAIATAKAFPLPRGRS